MKLFTLKPKHIIAATLLIVVSIAAGCKKEDEEPADINKTNQECMDQSGPAYFSNAQGDCQWSGALGTTTAVNHWHSNLYDLQFIRNGSNTSGTGKMKYNNGAVSTFNWEMDVHDISAITISGYDNVYTATYQISLVTGIGPNATTNPTGFYCDYTSGSGTYSVTFSLVAGAL